jgi:hypothetical protein
MALSPSPSKVQVIATPAAGYVSVPRTGPRDSPVRFDPNANGLARAAVIVRGSGQGAVVNLLGQGTTKASDLVAVLLNTLGLADALEAVA